MIMLAFSDEKDSIIIAFELLKSMNAVQTLHTSYQGTKRSQLNFSVWQIVLKNKVLTDRENLCASNFCTVFIDELKGSSGIIHLRNKMLEAVQEEENQKILCKKN